MLKTRSRSDEATARLAARAREAGDVLTSRVDRDELDSAREAMGRLLRLAFRLLSRLPQLAASVLGVTARFLYRVGDRSAEIAEVPTPRVTERRRGRRRAVLWFAGGFAAGAASGYAASELLNTRRDEDAYVPPTPLTRYPGSDTAAG